MPMSLKEMLEAGLIVANPPEHIVPNYIKELYEMQELPSGRFPEPPNCRCTLVPGGGGGKGGGGYTYESHSPVLFGGPRPDQEVREYMGMDGRIYFASVPARPAVPKVEVSITVDELDSLAQSDLVLKRGQQLLQELQKSAGPVSLGPTTGRSSSEPVVSTYNPKLKPAIKHNFLKKSNADLGPNYGAARWMPPEEE